MTICGEFQIVTRQNAADAAKNDEAYVYVLPDDNLYIMPLNFGETGKFVPVNTSKEFVALRGYWTVTCDWQFPAAADNHGEDGKDGSHVVLTNACGWCAVLDAGDIPSERVEKVTLYARECGSGETPPEGEDPVQETDYKFTIPNPLDIRVDYLNDSNEIDPGLMLSSSGAGDKRVFHIISLFKNQSVHLYLDIGQPNDFFSLEWRPKGGDDDDWVAFNLDNPANYGRWPAWVQINDNYDYRFVPVQNADGGIAHLSVSITSGGVEYKDTVKVIILKDPNELHILPRDLEQGKFVPVDSTVQYVAWRNYQKVDCEWQFTAKDGTNVTLWDEGQQQNCDTWNSNTAVVKTNNVVSTNLDGIILYVRQLEDPFTQTPPAGDENGDPTKEADYKFTIFKLEVENPIDWNHDSLVNDVPVGGAPPGGTNDTGNEFAYSTATPGLLKIKAILTIEPDIAGVRNFFADKVRVRTSSISDSHGSQTNVQMAWDNAFPGEPTTGKGVYDAADSKWKAEVTFTTLPLLNSDFGPKTVVVQACAPGGVPFFEKQIPIEVFWPLLIAPLGLWTDANYAKNHPGPNLNGTAAAGDMYVAPGPCCPNWFYYWLQCLPPGQRTDEERYGGDMRNGMGNRIFGATPALPSGFTLPMGRIYIGRISSQDDGDPDAAAGPRQKTTGIDTLRDVVIHERHHALMQQLKWTNEGFGRHMTAADPMDNNTWSFFFLPADPPGALGRRYNHYFDINGDGNYHHRDLDGDGDWDSAVIESAIIAGAGGPQDVNGDGDQTDLILEGGSRDLNGDGDRSDTVLESAIVPAAGGPLDWNGDGDQTDMVFEGTGPATDVDIMDLNGDGDCNDRVQESAIAASAGGPRDLNGDGDLSDEIYEKDDLDADADDAPDWDDRDPLFNRAPIPNVGTESEEGALDSELDIENALKDLDWGNPGKNHDKIQPAPDNTNHYDD